MQCSGGDIEGCGRLIVGHPTKERDLDDVGLTSIKTKLAVAAIRRAGEEPRWAPDPPEPFDREEVVFRLHHALAGFITWYAPPEPDAECF